MLLVGDYHSTDGEDYFYAVIDRFCKTIIFAKNFSCQAALKKLYPDCKIEFTGKSPDINKVSKKYRIFKIL